VLEEGQVPQCNLIIDLSLEIIKEISNKDGLTVFKREKKTCKDSLLESKLTSIHLSRSAMIASNGDITSFS
jgi:hypothetical protein